MRAGQRNYWLDYTVTVMGKIQLLMKIIKTLYKMNPCCGKRRKGSQDHSHLCTLDIVYLIMHTLRDYTIHSIWGGIVMEIRKLLVGICSPPSCGSHR